MARTSLQPVRNTQLVKVSFDSGDPELAARVPNTLAVIYIVADLESRTEATQRTTQFLAKQSEDLKAKLVESERACSSSASARRSSRRRVCPSLVPAVNLKICPVR
jgi:uncharacterized protein involved in exopolysaccharide biosynthesis